MDAYIDELQDNLFRICLYAENGFISFNHFLIRDEQPTLIHTGHAKTFDLLKDQVSTLIRPEKLRYIAFSHVEPDECGSLNQWLNIAPSSQSVVGRTCATSLKDFAIREPLVLKDGQSLSLGQHSLTLLETPHFPHGWDACLFYESHTKTLFSSDLGTQRGFKQQLLADETSLQEMLELQRQLVYMPWGPQMSQGIRKLLNLEIDLMAVMHGAALPLTLSLEFLLALEAENKRQVTQYTNRLPENELSVSRKY